MECVGELPHQCVDAPEDMQLEYGGRRKHRSTSQKMETQQQVAMIYRSVPESYGGLVTATKSRPDAEQTIELVNQKVIDEHVCRIKCSSGTSERAMLQSTRRNPEECDTTVESLTILRECVRCCNAREKKKRKRTTEEVTVGATW